MMIIVDFSRHDSKTNGISIMSLPRFAARRSPQVSRHVLYTRGAVNLLARLAAEDKLLHSVESKISDGPSQWRPYSRSEDILVRQIKSIFNIQSNEAEPADHGSLL
jgi:hypothetical protein